MDGLIRLLRFRKTLSSITHYFFSLDFFDYYGGLRQKKMKNVTKNTLNLETTILCLKTKDFNNIDFNK